jgi:hypothetical protein
MAKDAGLTQACLPPWRRTDGVRTDYPDGSFRIDYPPLDLETLREQLRDLDSDDKSQLEILAWP